MLVGLGLAECRMEEFCKVRKFNKVPLGDSVFQIEKFIAVGTPERKYRACVLQLRTKERALKECEFRRRKLEIDREEKVEKLCSLKENSYERRRLEIEVEEIDYNTSLENDLIEDCAVEIATYRKILEGLPEFTRDDFEASEKQYWLQRLLGDANKEMVSIGTVSKGTLDALENLGVKGERKDNRIVFVEVGNRITR